MRLRVESVESDHPGYDEYRYNIGNIGHNPYELLAYLSVKYGEFGMTTMQSALLDIFNRQYALTFAPSAETAYNDPTDADGDGDLEAYTRNVLNVTLSVRMQSELFYADMNEKERKQYDVYMHTKGGLQGVANPVDANWLYLVTSDFGYYVGCDDLRFNDGVTISPSAAAEAKAGVDGIVAETQTSTANGGPYVVLETVTEEAAVVRIKYGGLQEIFVSAGQEVKIGDALGKTGANGLYFEIKLGNTAMNPLFFADTGDTGKLLPVYGDAPPPPGDGTVAAFLAEAQSHLGTPYYFYTVVPSTPPTSFNCSSFVNYALNRSGFMSVSYSNATYLYLNSCVPITAEEAVPGDLIFFEGTYSGATLVSHVGIYLGGDQMVHSGNPNRYASINTAFWREHFYTFARLKTG